ncbi:hypothetical protein JVT61DRAFT_12279 [Boletus reticuloceps]|uniref:Uncharacterized protein n=1 Tax=Boletus reticuloceps TaxID=495285 RepID=A0A8I3A4B2_9AGAM|nr:hypothetical protein JVT61DRAFT_12279 [Boletus reticuloceps]
MILEGFMHSDFATVQSLSHCHTECLAQVTARGGTTPRNDDSDDGMGINLDGGDDVSLILWLALFPEYKHVPLRREDINKKGIHLSISITPNTSILLNPRLVLGSYTRSFNAVLLKAQVLLGKTFASALSQVYLVILSAMSSRATWSPCNTSNLRSTSINRYADPSNLTTTRRLRDHHIAPKDSTTYQRRSTRSGHGARS